MSEARTFDYVVVGAGSAGCVLANRLSADPNVSVCLIEAGPAITSARLRMLTTMPAGMVTLLASAKTNWLHELIDERDGEQRIIPCPRGRIVGGTSVVNGMVYARGHAADYDGWSARGNAGWSYADVLPFFRIHEDFADGENAWHGTGGEVRVERLADAHGLTRAFLDAAAQAGFARSDDLNVPHPDGFGLHHLSQRGGERLSSARSFLDPVRSRPNLTLLADTSVRRILLSGSQANGVEVHRKGQTERIVARREVVLSAGAINSPQLLLLSGIGDPADLAALGIPVTMPLTGVGRNFQDHPGTVVVHADRSRTSLALTARGLPGLAVQPLRYLLRREGALAGSVINGGGYVRSRPDLDRPDLKIDFMPLARPFGKVMPRFHGFNVFAWLLRPESRGRLTLRSADPDSKPLVRPEFLRSDTDVAAMVGGVRIIRRIMAQPAMAAFDDGEVSPGVAVEDFASLRDHIVRTHGTIYHPAGTCRMGPDGDPDAVVDARLRVRGIAGLRVADTSIMPDIVSGNTNAPAMMIAERAAAFIREDAAADLRTTAISRARSTDQAERLK